MVTIYPVFLSTGEPYVIVHPSPDQTILAAGQEITLTCASAGNPRPSIVWTLDGEELRVNETLFSAISLFDNPYSTQSDLTIGPATPNVTGTYQCLARGYDFVGELVVAVSNTSQLTIHCKYSHRHLSDKGEIAGYNEFVVGPRGQGTELCCI